MTTTTETIALGPLTISHPSKVLWSSARGEAPYTKIEYLRYLRDAAPAILPHLRGRPLVLTRYPHGAEGPSFYQKNVPTHAPDWIQRFTDHHGANATTYMIARDPLDLVWLGQQAALEFHVWLATRDRPEYPDRAVIDLDPMPPLGFSAARDVARVLRPMLDRAGVSTYLKTSGATGLHLFIPVAPTRTHREVALAVRPVGLLLQRLWPEQVTMVRSVRERGPRVYFDYLQNGRGKTLCAAYSPRPLPGAPVSTPITWNELEGVDPLDFNIRTVPERLRQRGEVWASLPRGAPQDLEALTALARGALGSAAVPD